MTFRSPPATLTKGSRAIASSVINVYDGLLLWDLSRSDKPSEIRPGLATSHEIDHDDHQRWIAHLRRGVKWHDGCDFKADDVV